MTLIEIYLLIVIAKFFKTTARVIKRYLRTSNLCVTISAVFSIDPSC